MIKSLKLTNFKNFRQATLPLGKLTLLVGTNASGKTNLLDAFRFLHGVARGYTISEVIGKKWGEGGNLEWPGIRGGTPEIAYRDSRRFSLELELDDPQATYRIAVDVGGNGERASVAGESLYADTNMVFDSSSGEKHAQSWPADGILVEVPPILTDTTHVQLSRFNPVLGQFARHPVVEIGGPAEIDLKTVAQKVVNELASLRAMRFFDFAPDALRTPSLIGQDALGSRGENLSSTLQAICADTRLKRAALSWVEALTPVDVVDFEFVDVGRGEVSLTLVESGGHKTSVYSASDGTLRFLGMLAALMGPNRAKLYFFEEIENAIHPTRLHLLVDLLEQQVAQGDVQIVATTHAPQVLGFLSAAAREDAVLTYRLEGHPDAGIRRILDIPHARRVLERQDLSRLHVSGWLENSMAFLEGAEQPT